MTGVVGGRLTLAGELRLAVGRDRVDGVGLQVGLGLGAVEDVVGRREHDLAAGRGGGRGEVARAESVHHRRLVQVALGAVDVRPGRAVDERLGLLGPDRPLDRAGIGDVELVVGEGGDVVAGLLHDAHDVAAEHPAGSRDQHLHRIWISESSPTMNR